MKMNRKQFLDSIRKTYEDGVKLIEIKNKDYGADTNPFKNFESARVIGLDVQEAILLRTLDKMSRIGNLIKQDAVVKDETIEDTLVDAINYLAILKAYREQEATEKKK